MPFDASVDLMNPMSLFLIGCIGAFCLGAGITTAMKGKWFCFVAGFFVGIVWVVAACRLAKPDSFWAREFYSDEGRDLAASRLVGPSSRTSGWQQPA
jgi:hypothetical protein